MTLAGLFVRLLGLAAGLMVLVFRDNVLEGTRFERSIVIHYAFILVSFFVCVSIWSCGKWLDRRLHQRRNV